MLRVDLRPTRAGPHAGLTSSTRSPAIVRHRADGPRRIGWRGGAVVAAVAARRRRPGFDPDLVGLERRDLGVGRLVRRAGGLGPRRRRAFADGGRRRPVGRARALHVRPHGGRAAPDHQGVGRPARRRCRPWPRALSDHYGCDLSTSRPTSTATGRDSVGLARRPGRPAAVADTVVAIVSLGAPRRFLLRPKGGGPSLPPDPGAAATCWCWAAPASARGSTRVPKCATAGPRISVMFREAY